jgi:hypothetical protein
LRRKINAEDKRMFPRNQILGLPELEAFNSHPFHLRTVGDLALHDNMKPAATFDLRRKLCCNKLIMKASE